MGNDSVCFCTSIPHTHSKDILDRPSSPGILSFCIDSKCVFFFFLVGVNIWICLISNSWCKWDASWKRPQWLSKMGYGWNSYKKVPNWFWWFLCDIQWGAVSEMWKLYLGQNSVLNIVPKSTWAVEYNVHNLSGHLPSERKQRAASLPKQPSKTTTYGSLFIYLFIDTLYNPGIP